MEEEGPNVGTPSTTEIEEHIAELEGTREAMELTDNTTTKNDEVAQ